MGGRNYWRAISPFLSQMNHPEKPLLKKESHKNEKSFTSDTYLLFLFSCLIPLSPTPGIVLPKKISQVSLLQALLFVTQVRREK